MGKVKNEIYYYLIADIFTKILQKCSFSSSLPNILNFVQTAEFDLLSWQPKGWIRVKILKNQLLRSHKGDEAETLQKCS